MSPRIFIERPITSVEDAEGLPVGTVAVTILDDGRVADAAVRKDDPVDPWEAGAEAGRSYTHAQMVGWTALVPVEAESAPAPITTVGDLPLFSIGSTVVAVEHEGATVTGVISAMDLHVGEWRIVHNLVGEATASFPPDVRVDLTIGQVTLKGLHRSHPCEVIA